MNSQTLYRLFGIVAASAALPASAQEIPLSELAEEVRAALGYGVEQMAAMAVPAAEQDAIGMAVATRVSSARAQLEPLVQQRRAALRERVYASTSVERYAQAVTAIEAADQAIRTAVEGLGGTLRNELSPDRQAAADRWAGNRGVDPLLAFIGGLTDEQRDVLRAARLDRDRMLEYPRNWHRDAAQARIWHAYQTTVSQTLTPDQMQMYRDLYARYEANLGTAFEREEAARQAIEAEARVRPVRPAEAKAGAVYEAARQLRDGLGRMLKGWSIRMLQSSGQPAARPQAANEPGFAPQGG